MKWARFTFQITIVIAAAVTGLRHAMGWTTTTIETYCPFGGLETAYALLTQKQFSCATGERNLALFGALLVLTLISRKSFCAWICPVGTVSEWCSAAGRRLFKRRKDDEGRPLHALEPTRPVDRALRWLRLPVLLVILYFTYKTGELIFRGFDPYYILFSANGHDVEIWSYAILAVILAGIVILPMAWCRYLCPLSVALWPFSKIGVLRLERNPEHCTGCGLCDRVCPHSIDVSEMNEVTSGECTLCFECTDQCPEEGALKLMTPKLMPMKVSLWIVPILVVALTVAGLGIAELFSIPTVELVLVDSAEAPQDTATLTLIIPGVRCKDTAISAGANVEEIPGVITFVAFASHNRVEITYDPQLTDPASLIEAIEGPVYDAENGEFLFGVFVVSKIIEN